MLQSQAPIIMKISSILACLILVHANADGNGGGEASESTQMESSNGVLKVVSMMQPFQSIEASSTPSLNCSILTEGTVRWMKDGKELNATENERKESKRSQTYEIKNANRNDTGNYTCVGKLTNGTEVSHTVHIRVIEPGKITSGMDARVKLGEPAELSCNMEGYPMENVTWIKLEDSQNSEHLMNRTRIEPNDPNETYRTTFLTFPPVSRKDNGTYECRVRDYSRWISGQANLVVKEAPQVDIDLVKAVGAGSIYLNWTVDDHNDHVRKYVIQHMQNGTESWQYVNENIGGDKSSYVIKGLDKSTAYKFKILAENSVGESHPAISKNYTTTLAKDPEFVPTVSVKGTTITSITIGWSAPPLELRDHVHYYKIMAKHKNEVKESVYLAETTNIYVFENLDSGTNYLLKVAACSDYTQECGNWSVEQEGQTIDGVASPPQSVKLTCSNATGSVSVTWKTPEKPNGMITRYDIVLTGKASFVNEQGKQVEETFTPMYRRVDVNKPYIATFDNVPFNTQYTIRVSGVTRLRTASGEDATDSCTMKRGPPNKENLVMRPWRKVEGNNGVPLFQLNLNRISERNGPICCYRIFVVKLGHKETPGNLQPPEDIEVHSYREAYDSLESDAYLAEMYDSAGFEPNLFIGTGENSVNKSKNCNKCVGLKQTKITPKFEVQVVPDGKPPSVVSTAANITEMTSTQATVQPTAKPGRRKRENSGATEDRAYAAENGLLDVDANYTGFLEVMIYGDNEGEFFTAYSSYLEQRFAGKILDTGADAESSTLGIMMHICIALLILVLVILMGMCLLHRYLKHTREGGEEIISLRNSFRHLCRTLRGRHQLVASSPPDMAPIGRADLLQAYIDRHKDSDYGFQHEFELLPDRFADRTTRASESRENLYKNRYPDIKCYDQTRVRLAQVDGISGSDYINANFVLGYKERKKFICAQGPMENTVCDYWRMIWEQHLELVLMLTNLEEYSKTKCAKYWPDKTESKNFGDITVEHVREIPYSDYVVRELKMTRTGERESRIIIQHHFLVWKDFMAPEHPHAILRFIKRVNEAYSLEKGPILVHCSAGVGRTGTLVALDSLLQQLADEGQVSIFNTVCDLRHQRNFLVQSLKQYIFVYRSLMEMAQFGDTEIAATQLKNFVEKLRLRENGKDKSKMEEEYEKISSVLEDRKSFSVGGGDENRIKNRNELVIPYDRNRVILTPVPGREHSTYINASFIEGYDNSESFIITQDPIETTIPDFWRMISEQCATTIVMLSDLSEGPRKCPRYWPDDEIAYDHIRVRYIQSESCPYYTRRELCVGNSKTDESMVVTQYHYHGWPTVEGEVPEVTRGLIELVDQTTVNDVYAGGPLVVHCHCGSDRSSMFVALSILVQQLRTERRVDIFTTTKKLRSQRHGMIGSFAQYEFLHRAIVNYSDLHKIGEEESAS